MSELLHSLSEENKNIIRSLMFWSCRYTRAKEHFLASDKELTASYISPLASNEKVYSIDIAEHFKKAMRIADVNIKDALTTLDKNGVSKAIQIAAIRWSQQKGYDEYDPEPFLIALLQKTLKAKMKDERKKENEILQGLF